ncbi:MAG: hypothetical protein LBD89_03980 [Tannerellaceae bacterium]|jgi:hypothetical protein|nr:hypothetical protein [Tannerellaceae bacterium]
MNKFLSVFLLLLLTQCADNLPETYPEADLPKVEDAYVYPEDIQGMVYEEIQDAYRLPPDVLESISTAGLICSLIDFPWLWGIYWTSSNASPIGTSYRVYAQHNSVEALEERPDRADVLLSYYKSIDPRCFANAQSFMERPAQLTVLQALFTRNKILSQYNKEAKQEIVSLLLQRYGQTGASFGTLEVMTWIMYNDLYKPVVRLFNNALNPEWFTFPEDLAEPVIAAARDFAE